MSAGDLDSTPLPAPAAATTSADPSGSTQATPASVPPWFRAVAWDSLLGALCCLLPVPFVDDLAVARMRRRMVERVLSGWGVVVSPAQLALLAGGRRPWSVGRVLGKAFIYPFKELLRKILYFLAIKDAADTFSLLFHQGYLLHAALGRGALGGAGQAPVAAPLEARIAAVADAVHGTLAATDTRPLGQLFRGVFRNSGRLLSASTRWLGSLLRRRDAIAVVPEDPSLAGIGGARQPLGSPEAEQLLDRLLLVLWGERRYLDRLDAELARRLPAG